ncbi:hypothetical protein [Microseira wollei]|nr:hypothetical protein [Microseira wollei]
MPCPYNVMLHPMENRCISFLDVLRSRGASLSATLPTDKKNKLLVIS